MNIFYFSPATSEKTFVDLLSPQSNGPNPSNQLFHHGIIRALSAENKMLAVTSLPLPKYPQGPFWVVSSETIEEGIIYHAFPFLNIRFLKGWLFGFYTERLLSYYHKTGDAQLFLVDALNLTLFRAAKKIAKKHNFTLVGIITDDPANLSGVSPTYVRAVKRGWACFDAYITVTEGLNALANPKGKPHYVLPGIVENRQRSVSNKTEFPYFFFGGALYERYGIDTLLMAFSKIRHDIHLIIAGQGPAASLIKEAAQRDSRIHYVGLLSPEENQAYAAGAILNINPRPVDDRFDSVSFPSKLLHYMASGVPTLTVDNPQIRPLIGESLVWAKSGTPDAMAEAMETYLTLSTEERQKMGQLAQRFVHERFGTEVQGQRLSRFLRLLK